MRIMLELSTEDFQFQVQIQPYIASKYTDG